MAGYSLSGAAANEPSKRNSTDIQHRS